LAKTAFGQNCSLPFTNLDIPALLKSWKKHYDLHHFQVDLIGLFTDQLARDTRHVILPNIMHEIFKF
jgi:hypothetical protein